jgi:hypothetical protein
MHEVQIDVDEVRLAVGPMDDVVLPDLLGEGSGHLVGLLLVQVRGGVCYGMSK